MGRHRAGGWRRGHAAGAARSRAVDSLHHRGHVGGLRPVEEKIRARRHRRAHAETIILFPFAIAMLLWWHHTGTGALGRVDAWHHVLVLSVGVVTAIPLLLFAYGAQRIRLTTLGLLQYLAPTVQFLIGYFIYREPFDAVHLQAYTFIWCGLIIYSADGFWAQRRLFVRGGAGTDQCVNSCAGPAARLGHWATP